MSSINLLPEARRDRRAARTLLRRWSVGVAGWCVLLVTTYAVLERSRPREAVEGLRGESALLVAEEERLRGELVGLERDVAASRRSIEAARATIDHPDWSVLLATIVALRDESMVFRRWELARGADGSLRLLLDGTTPTIISLTEFAVALERLGVFHRVHLGGAEMKSEPLAHAPSGAVHFSIHAELVQARPPNGGARP